MDMTDFFCDMEGHYFADKSKPYFKVFVKKVTGFSIFGRKNTSYIRR
tara:strand:- start:1643 stop:1783 length:141 start_codon:yes stop_codon:yes gene_type:complete